MPRSAPRTALLLAVPLALAVAAYARVLHGEFVFDDQRAVVEGGARLGPASVLAGSWTDFRRGGRPVVDLTFALNRHFGGVEPFGYHLVNLALHLVTALLLWRLALTLLRRTGAARAEWQALAAAGLWVVHPLGSQAVSYVTQRAEVLASGLMVAALLAFLSAGREGRTWRGAAALGLGLVAFGLALGSKAMAVTTPALWALAAWAAPARAADRAPPAWRTLAVALLAPVGLAATHALGTLRALTPAGNAGFDLPGLDPWSYLLSQFRVVVTYARLVFWPAGQSVDWYLAPSRSLLEPVVLASGALLLALAAGAVALVLRGRRRDDEDGAAMRLAGLGVLWFLVVLAPTSTVVPVADLLVEHRAYLASWGLVLALVAAGERAAARVRWRHAGSAAAVGVAALWLVLAGMLHARNAVWESALALWSDAVARGQPRWEGYFSIGVELERRGDLAAALTAYRTALERAAGQPRDEARVLHNTGRTLLTAGRPAEAEEALEGAAARAPAEAETAYALAFAKERRGDLAGAERWAARALAAEPRHAGAAEMLAMLRLRAGRTEEGIAMLRMVVGLQPANVTARTNLGVALQEAGRPAEACAAWRAAHRAGGDGPQRRRVEQRLAESGCPGDEGAPHDPGP